LSWGKLALYEGGLSPFGLWQGGKWGLKGLFVVDSVNWAELVLCVRSRRRFLRACAVLPRASDGDIRFEYSARLRYDMLVTVFLLGKYWQKVLDTSRITLKLNEISMIYSKISEK